MSVCTTRKRLVLGRGCDAGGRADEHHRLREHERYKLLTERQNKQTLETMHRKQDKYGI